MRGAEGFDEGATGDGFGHSWVGHMRLIEIATAIAVQALRKNAHAFSDSLSAPAPLLLLTCFSPKQYTTPSLLAINKTPRQPPPDAGVNSPPASYSHTLLTGFEIEAINPTVAEPMNTRFPTMTGEPSIAPFGDEIPLGFYRLPLSGSNARTILSCPPNDHDIGRHGGATADQAARTFSVHCQTFLGFFQSTQKNVAPSVPK